MKSIRYKKLSTPKLGKCGNDENGFAKLQWDKVDGADKYVIYRSTDRNGLYLAINEVRTTSFTDFSATASGKYFYKVVAFSTNEKATSAFSQPVEVNVSAAYAHDNEIENVKAIERQKEMKTYGSTVFRRTGLENMPI